MEEFGVAADQNVITGNPRYDSIVDYLARAKDYRAQFLGGEDAGKIIALVATTGLMELDRQWLDDACELAEEMAITLIIKPHPSLGCEPYRPWQEKYKTTCCWDGNLYEVAVACDVLLTDYSSTGWEAVLFSKSMITLNSTGNEFPYRWEDEGVAVRVSNREQLQEQFRALIDGSFIQ